MQWGVVDAVDRKLFGPIVLIFERIRGARFRVDERGYLLSFFIRQTGGGKVRHRIPDDPGQRINPGSAGAVIPDRKSVV